LLGKSSANLKFAICDFGMGITQHVRDNMKFENIYPRVFGKFGIDLCLYNALRPGITSKSVMQNMGM